MAAPVNPSVRTLALTVVVSTRWILRIVLLPN
jgi:hypothetical protein